MKKIILAIALLCSFLISQGQVKDCSIEELILLNERPQAISERDAFDLIRKEKKEIILSFNDSPNEKYSQSLEYPFSKFNVFQKRVKVTLVSVLEKKLPVWKSATYYVPYKQKGLTSYWIASAIGFLIAFLLLLAIINQIPWKWKEQLGYSTMEWEDSGNKDRLVMLGLGLGLSLIATFVFYGISMAEKKEYFLSGERYRFVWREYLFQAMIIYLGFLTYVIGHHIRLCLKYSEIRKKIVNA